jgi:protein TonB
MTDVEKLLVCAAASLVAHFALERGLEQLPPRGPLRFDHKIAIQVVEPKDEPPPEPPKEEPKPPPKQEVHEAPRAHQPRPEAPQPKDVPPPDKAPMTTDTTDQPVFGVTLESTSQGGNGPAMPVGNTTKPTPNQGSAAPAAPKQLAEPVAAFEATKMPLPQGRCIGKYTDDAKSAGLEGTVVLDLIVGEDGRVRDVQVVQGLGKGLSEAAIAALRACRFSPGEKDGKPVPVRVRGFKIHFVLAEAD